jgi:hypothetical protein
MSRQFRSAYSFQASVPVSILMRESTMVNNTICTDHYSRFLLAVIGQIVAACADRRGDSDITDRRLAKILNQ